jgi:16S rRNA (uracil1498-N3)-methyltransferase
LTVPIAMHRFFVPELSMPVRAVHLPEGEAAHAARVLRLQPGERVTILNGRGLRGSARVVRVDRRQVELAVERIEEVPAPAYRITLFQAVTKPKSMEWIIQKATELGARVIQPVVTSRVVPHWAEGEGVRKVEKWRRIAVEALKQCGQPWLPHVEAPAALADLLGKAPPSFLASLQLGARPLREWLEGAADGCQVSVGSPVGLWIGPEGDFAPEEIQLLRTAGGCPITLGPLVLRSETAALCGLTLLNYELNLLRGGETAPGHGTIDQSGPGESES